MPEPEFSAGSTQTDQKDESENNADCSDNLGNGRVVINVFQPTVLMAKVQDMNHKGTDNLIINVFHFF